MSRRLFISFLMAMPFLWLAAFAYGQSDNWLDPTGTPPSNNLNGPVWLLPLGSSTGQDGDINVSGKITSNSSIVAGTSNPSPANTLTVYQLGDAKTSIYSLATGLASKAIYGEASNITSNDISYAIYGKATNATSWAGYFQGRVFAQQYCLPGATSSDPPVCGGAGGPGSSGELWSREGIGPNIYKGTASGLTGIVAIGTATPSAAGFPAGTRLALVGEGANGPRLFIDKSKGNPEIDFQLTSTTGDHWGIYTDSYDTNPSDSVVPTRELRFWVKESATASQGRNALALSADGVMIFPGWGPIYPIVTTRAATAITTTTATLNGLVNPNNSAATGWFRYCKIGDSGCTTTPPSACNNTFGIKVIPTTPALGNLGDGDQDVSLVSSISALNSNTKYYYCAISQNVNGIGYGSLLNFTTNTVLAPTVTSPTHSGVSISGATLGATVSADGGVPLTERGTCWNTTQWNITDPQALTNNNCVAASGTIPTIPFTFTHTRTGMSPNTLIYYRGYAKNTANLVGWSAESSFTTLEGPKDVTTNAASPIAVTSATLNGSANPNGLPTTGWFRYSTTSPGTCNNTFGTATGGTSLGLGTSAVGYSSSLTGLTASTTYYFCAVAQNTNSLAYGSVKPFSTSAPPPPSVTTSAATSITTTSATLNASANPQGAQATGWFRYSTTNPGACNDTFGTRAPMSGGTALGSGSSSVAYSQSVGGLTGGAIYYFCAFANNSGGTTAGGLKQFVAVNNPSVTTVSATSIQETKAVLNGSANPNGTSTTAWFRYSTVSPGAICSDDTKWGGVSNVFLTPSTPVGGAIENGTTSKDFSGSATGLIGGTTYYYCAIAKNTLNENKVYGAVKTFTTFSPF